MKQILINGVVWVLDQCANCPHCIHYQLDKPKKLCNFCKAGGVPHPLDVQPEAFNPKKIKEWDGQQKRKGK